MEKYILGLDIGGTKVEAALLKVCANKTSQTSFELPGLFINSDNHAYGQVL